MPLHVYQSLWGMQELPWRGGAAWTVEQQLDLVAGAGFDGVCVEAADPAVERTAVEAVARGLRIQIEAIPRTVDELAPVVETVERIGRGHVDHINLQPDVRPATVGECVPYLLGWKAIADDADVPLHSAGRLSAGTFRQGVAVASSVVWSPKASGCPPQK